MWSRSHLLLLLLLLLLHLRPMLMITPTAPTGGIFCS
jgi:hypothetical protein